MIIYLVEDDESIRELVVYALKAAGYDAVGFVSAEPFFEAVKSQKPHLVILDIMLPGEDGISILGKLRAGSNTGDLPVMLLTAKGTEYDKVLGLDSGADDYITKPFGMMELQSRVRALLRRSATAPQDAACLVLKDIQLDPAEYRVTAGGERVELTVKEFELLRVLMENPGRVLTRELLLEKVWDYHFDGETRTVDVHIRSLRRKLGDAGEQIETVRGVGYRIGGIE